jgi:hypothetical protein
MLQSAREKTKKRKRLGKRGKVKDEMVYLRRDEQIVNIAWRFLSVLQY